jgi:hypothetical protein
MEANAAAYARPGRERTDLPMSAHRRRCAQARIVLGATLS